MPMSATLQGRTRTRIAADSTRHRRWMRRRHLTFFHSCLDAQKFACIVCEYECFALSLSYLCTNIAWFRVRRVDVAFQHTNADGSRPGLQESKKTMNDNDDGRTAKEKKEKQRG